MLVGRDTSDSDFNTILKTGGEKQHTLSVKEMPSHRHSYGEPRYTGGDWSCLGDTCNMNQSLNADDANVFHGYTFYTGGSQSHNNLQPYIVVYRWRRIA